MADSPKDSLHLTERQWAYHQAAQGVRHYGGVHSDWCLYRNVQWVTTEGLAKAIVQDGEQESTGHRRDERR